MYEVKVKGFPVRHKGERYLAGETFKMKKEHVNESLVEVIGEVEKLEIVKEIEEMTLNELKDYATEKNIDLKGLTKKDDIIAIIRAADGDNNGDE